MPTADEKSSQPMLYKKSSKDKSALGFSSDHSSVFMNSSNMPIVFMSLILLLWDLILRVAHILTAEFKLEIELERLLNHANHTFWDIYPTVETFNLVRTSSNSIISSANYPSKAVANETLSGRKIC